MKDKRKLYILLGVALISLVNSTVLNLSPMVFKQLNITSTWLIGTYITINTFFTYLGCSSHITNKICLKIKYNLVTILNIVIPSSLLCLTMILKSRIALYLYIISFIILQIARAISLNGVVMLDKDNVELVKYKNTVATITAIIGLFLGQLILDIGLIHFIFYILFLMLMSFILLLVFYIDIEQKQYIETKSNKVRYNKLGLQLGITRGCSLLISSIISFYIVLNTTKYGYFSVIESIFSILGLYAITLIIKKKVTSLKCLLSIRSIILFIPMILLMVMSNKINTLIIVISILTTSLSTIVEDVLINIIFAKLDRKNIEKHSILSSFYYKVITFFLVLSIIILKIFDCQSNKFIVIFSIIISIILIINYLILKKESKTTS